MERKPLCFVLMPFGRKKDPAGRPDIDFNRVYEAGIRQAVEDAGLEPIRADAEVTGGIIQKVMFERLLLCDFAVADLTTANANVFYELGVRHATRPRTTLALFAGHQPIPFDVNFLRSLPYELGPDNRFGDEEAAALCAALAARLRQLVREAHDGEAPDSPLFQLLQGYRAPDIARLKTDVFRDQVEYSKESKARIAAACRAGDRQALAALADELVGKPAVEAGVLVDLFLSFRAVMDWDGMVALYERLPAELQRTVLVREQLGFAQNRRGDWQAALATLEQVAAEQGPSSETCGLMGRVYKDRWDAERKAGNAHAARGWLRKAVDAYLRGFEADWRDAFPGINAVTLLEIQGDPESLRREAEIVPVVRYAVGRRMATGAPDYWDHATLLELAVLARDQKAAESHLADAVASVREPWEPETTARNLDLIAAARRERSSLEPWLDEIVAAMGRAAADRRGPAA